MTELGAIPPDASDVAQNRIRFLTAEPAETDRVRSSILASWRRSRDLNVAADRIHLPYLGDPDIDTMLVRSAEPVLTQLARELHGEPVSVVLTDPAGLVLSRRTGDRELERHLDKVLLAPGFSYAECFVGTNGIGTALEVGTATQVFGHEHYAENLENLACAGAPIHDPISHRLLGVIDLTCWRRNAQPLLIALARSTAAQIEQAVLTTARLTEFEVLHAYRQTCRRTTGIVFAVAEDAVLLNDHARAELSAEDQAALVTFANDAAPSLPVGRRRSVEVVLPSGAMARMHCQRVGAGARPAGLVVHVKVDRAPLASRDHPPVPSRVALPGLVGDAVLWRRACHQVEDALESRRWLAVEGEPGVGKLAILRAAQLRQQPPRRCTVLDGKDASTDRTWLGSVQQALAGTDSLVIAHVDRLDLRTSRLLCAELDRVKSAPAASRPWVAATLEQSEAGEALHRVLGYFPSTVSVPPLRLRLNDMPELVSFLLGKISRGGKVTCSSEALRLLMRATWPGNVAQLQQLLHDVAQRRRSGQITSEDLPPEMHTISRRVLSTLESIERDAIVRSLEEANGNKAQAARALGLSRATVYRKIHEFGIVTPN